eukprot:TRINITY_DN90251_c0_g1_i1.p1 TRINITY_DN90251_c0_g1~~TRINITY_DN90251_c0_g1_i1.p1  ORF type:complete len:530 (-),score=96.14 TRINITY_DN90251_c0_g1_i1:894-2483(-)
MAAEKPAMGEAGGYPSAVIDESVKKDIATLKAAKKTGDAQIRDGYAALQTLKAQLAQLREQKAVLERTIATASTEEADAKKLLSTAFKTAAREVGAPDLVEAAERAEEEERQGGKMACYSATSLLSPLIEKIENSAASSAEVLAEDRGEIDIWPTWVEEFKEAWHEGGACSEGSSEAVTPLPIQGGVPETWSELDIHQLLLGNALPASSGRSELPRSTLVSKEPLVAFIPGFASLEECSELIRLGFRHCKVHADWASEMAKPGSAASPARGVATCALDYRDMFEASDERQLLERLEERVSALTGVQWHVDECRPFLKFDKAGKDIKGHTKDDLNVGLHVDPNGGFSHRVCTVILYLNDCVSGRTVFPCVGDSSCHPLGRDLIHGGHTHTSHSGVEEGSLASQGHSLMEKAECSNQALRVTPSAGSALLFFSLLDEVAGGSGAPEGVAVDPLTWHGGASVVSPDVGKWTVQFFKEVPKEQRIDAASEAAYVGRLRRRVLAATADKKHASQLAGRCLPSDPLEGCALSEMD